MKRFLTICTGLLLILAFKNKDNSDAITKKSNNPNKTIDSLYNINLSDNLILVNEIRFRNKESSFQNHVEVKHINTKKGPYGFNTGAKNAFLFISFNYKPLFLKNKDVNIHISVLNKGQIKDSKQYFWNTTSGGDYFVWFPLEEKYFSCISNETNFKIEIIDNKTKHVIGSETVKYGTYCTANHLKLRAHKGKKTDLLVARQIHDI